jgi:hypothetical protein
MNGCQRIFMHLLPGVAVCFVSVASVLGQAGIYSSITGRVMDATGAVVPGVEVLAVNQATNVSRRAVSDDYGNYEVTHLHAGTYTITAEMPGFRRFVHQDIILESLRTVRIDVRLQVGEIDVEVTVTGTPVIESELPTISQVHTDRQVMDLPMNLRGAGIMYRFSLLTPTATQGSGSGRSFGGGRWTGTTFQIDGASGNDIIFGNQSSALQPPTDAIQEVKVDYVSNRAEFADSGTLSVITRGGSNRFRGSAYWHSIGTRFSSRDPFSPTRGDIDPVTGEEVHSRNDIFGGSLGGPIVRDRAFFYVSYEFDRDPRPSQISRNVPTLKMRQGDFSDLTAVVRNPFTGEPFPNNIIPPDMFNQTSLRAQQRFFPEPNFGAPGLVAGNFRGSFPRNRDLHKLNTRYDHNFSDAHTLFARVGHTDSNSLGLPYGGFPAEFVGGHSNSLTKAWQSTVFHTWTVSPRLINEARAAFSRTWESSGGPFPGTEVVDFLGIEGLERQPEYERRGPDIRISGFSRINQSGDDRRVANTYSISNQTTWIRNRHTMKGGLEFRPQQYNGPMRPDFGRYDFSNRYSGHAYADFLLGLPTSTQREQARPLLYFRWYYLSAFYQTDFRVSPRMTLNLGVRYDYNQPPYDKYDIISSFDPTSGSVIIPSEQARAAIRPLFPAEVPIITADQVGLPRGLRETGRGNVYPRIGFAFRPGADARMVVRAGYGIFNDDLSADYAAAFLARHGPFNLNEGFTNSITDGVPLLTFDRPFLETGTRLGALDVRGVARDSKNPYAQQWNLTVERDLGRDIGLRVSYIGTATTRAASRRDINQPLPSTEPFSQDRRPYPLYRQVLFWETGGRHNYHALSTNLDRRFQRGLSYQVAWTWAKSITDTELASEGGPTLENAYDRTRYRGNSRWVPRHRLVANLMWELPFGAGRRYFNQGGAINQVLGGWQITSVYIAQTGQFLTPSFTGRDPSNTNVIGGIPDRIGDGNLPKGQRTIDNWFDASAFAVPPVNAGRFGNSGVGIITGPGYQQLNLGLFKYFQVTEEGRLRVQATAVNALNHPIWNVPALNISAPGSVGRITSSLDRQDVQGTREIMFGLRYEF